MASSKSTFFYIKNPERWAWWSRIPRNQLRSGILHEEVLCWCKPSKWSTSLLKLWRNYTWIKYPSASSVPISKMQSELCELFEMMGLSNCWRVCKWIADLISCWVYYTFTRSCFEKSWSSDVQIGFALAQGPMQRQITLTLHSISMSQTSLINEHWHWDSSVSDHVELLAAFNVVFIHQLVRHMSITRAQLTTRASPFMRRWRSTIRQEWIGTLTPAVWHKHGCLEHLFLALNALSGFSLHCVEEVKRKP